MATEITSIAVQFPWAALITAIAGLSGALGGAFLANKFAENRWYKQVSFEKRKSVSRCFGKRVRNYTSLSQNGERRLLITSFTNFE